MTTCNTATTSTEITELPALFADRPSRAASSPDPLCILQSIGEVPYEWRLDTDALAWGANAEQVLMLERGVTFDTGRSYAALLAADNTQTRFEVVTQSALKDEGGGVPYQLEYAIEPKPGVRVWIEDIGRWFAGAHGRPVRAHGVIRSVNDRRARDERLKLLSRYDALTGEMNRQALLEVLAEALDEALRYRSSCGFLIVAVDNLTHLNGAYGFEVADQAISAVGQRLRSRMRGADALGRFSGNKFGIVLKSASTDDIAMAAERFLSAIREDVVQTRSGAVAVTVSIGGVAAPRHARTVDEITARAHESLEFAKRRRLGSFEPYRPSVEREAQRRDNIRITDEIVTALNERRVLLAYEPIVATRSREVAFHECLVRVRATDGSLLGAGNIVPQAERLGLVRLIDHRMLDLVIADLAARPELKASVNVSPASTNDPDWWENLEAQMRLRPELARRLTLEITEMAAIADIDDARGFVVRAKDLGCRIAIDDFGAGHTSFRNLRKLGVDIVKIDGAFIQKLPNSPDDQIFVQSMIGLAHALGLETVAEWVQDESAAALLAEWGCDYLQGTLIGSAMTKPPFEIKAANGPAPAAA